MHIKGVERNLNKKQTKLLDKLVYKCTDSTPNM